VIGVIAAGSLPLGAVAFMLSSADWRQRRRLAQLAALLGLAVLLATTTGCSRPVARPGLATPIQAVSSPSPACV